MILFIISAINVILFGHAVSGRNKSAAEKAEDVRSLARHQVWRREQLERASREKWGQESIDRLSTQLANLDRQLDQTALTTAAG